LPHATILGVEQKQVDVLAFENGFWNRISASDLESQLATLPELARQKASESGLLAEAETALQTQLNERIHAERPVHLVFQSSPVKE
jgi:F0F1-type ATP synthase epsilon subunit